MNTPDLDALLRQADSAATAALCDFIGVASISARGEALREGAEAVQQLCQRCGLLTRLLLGPGAPVVHAWRAAPAGAPTVLFYGHYDVQPPEPLDAWHSDPFRGEIRDGAVYGRGAGDNKGQLLAHLFAVRALLEARQLAVGVEFLIEGEEEIGSPHLGAIVEAHRHELRADLAITADAPVHEDGSPVVILGVRGLLYLEIEARGAATDVHSGNRGGVAPTPAWDLVQALAGLRSADGVVTVPGFHDAIRPPTATEQRMVAALPPLRAALHEQLQVERLATNGDPWTALMFEPTLNICGLTSGYQGAGAKTVIPARATAKVDVRLVADQDPDAIFAALAEQLLRRNPGLTVRKLAAVPPSATAPDAPYVQTVISAVREATGQAPLIRPRLGGTTPDYVFTKILQLPSVLVPYGPPDMNHHAPNERMTLAALHRGIRCTAAILRAVGASGA